MGGLDVGAVGASSTAGEITEYTYL